MEFEYTQEEEEFREELHNWYEENLPEGWLDGDRDLPDDPDEREEFLRNWQRKLYEGGWAGIHWPEDYGGRGATLMEQVIYNEVTSKLDPPRSINSLGIGFVGPTIAAAGTEEQKERFLPNILNAEEIWCQGYSEPNSGSDLASLQCKAIDEGDHFQINGQKIWTSSAHLADWCFLLTRTDDTGNKHHGITALLVDMSQDAITTERIHQATDSRSFNQVYFDGATARKEYVVGEIDDGWRVAMQLSAFERVALTQAYSLERRLEELAEYCKTKTRNGEPLSEDPTVRQKIAEFDARIQAGKLTYLRNVSKQMNTGAPGPEGSMDKVYTGKINSDLQRFGAKLLGPQGGLWGDSSDSNTLGGNQQLGYLASLGGSIAGGTQDVQRNIIAERVLGLPKDNKE